MQQQQRLRLEQQWARTPVTKRVTRKKTMTRAAMPPPFSIPKSFLLIRGSEVGVLEGEEARVGVGVGLEVGGSVYKYPGCG